MFTHEWLDSYSKLSHLEMIVYEEFHSNLKTTNIKDEYEQLLKIFEEK